MSDVSKVYDCFLCFHDCDAEKAIAILEYCEKKENGGYKFFHVDRDCTGGPFSDVFRLALDQSKTIMILVSQQALTERWFDVLMNESLIVYIEEKVQIITVFIEDDYYDGLPEMLHSFYKLKYYTPFFWYQLKEMLRNQLNPSNS